MRNYRSRSGRGKSGSYRVVTYYGGGDLPVFLLNVFKKGDRVNLSKAEINDLREELSHLAREYREGAVRHDKKAGGRMIASVRKARAFARGETDKGFAVHVPDAVNVRAIRKRLALTRVESPPASASRPMR